MILIQVLKNAMNKIPFGRLWFAVFLPALTMAPVLFWPHYGLFSDAGQAIEFPKEVIANFPRSLALLRPLEDGRWNPLFHGLTILIYAVVPDSARALFFAQWVMFAASSLTVVWVLTKLTRSKWLAILGVAIFCTSSSIFESFFTLDKVEPRVTVFSSLIVASLVARFLSGQNDENRQRWWSFVMIQGLLGIWVIFSKETGTYLIAAFGGTWLACLLNPTWGHQVRTLFRNAFAVNSVVVIAFILLFKLLSANMSYRYVTYEITPLLLVHNASYYLTTSPELTLSLLCAVYWCLRVFWRRLPGPQDSVQAILVFISIGTLSYFSGICLWRWPLDYYLLPAHYMAALLLPLTLWACAKQKIIWWPVLRMAAWLLGIVWCGYFGFRLILGYAIYAQDAVKDDVAHYLSQPEWFGKRIVLPLSHPDNAEIGERLEYFINRNRSEEHPVNLFNFWEPPSGNRQNFERYKNTAGISPDERLLHDIAQHPDRFVIWQFGTSEKASLELMRRQYEENDDEVTGWTAGMIWRPGYLSRGDVLLVPTGSRVLARLIKWSNARGLSLYGESQQDFMRKFSLKLTPLAHIHRGPEFASIGWDLFRVDGNTEDTDVSLGYSLASLMTLNQETDITPPSTSRAMFEEKVLPRNGLYLGEGWYDLENSTGVRFRWMSTNSEIVLTHLPAGNCTFSADVEPLLMPDSGSFTLVFRSGTDQSEFSLQGRKTVTFKVQSTGKNLQVIHLSSHGGATRPPEGDTRLLKLRAFSFNLLQCSEY